LGLPGLLVLAGLSTSVSNTSANSPLQVTALPGLRGQTVSLYMLALRGGVSVGSLLTGLSVSLLGIRQARLINGILAIVAQIVVGCEWFRSPMPSSALKTGVPTASGDFWAY
jgi:predicted MFS family arabinose efflux permease